MAVKIQSIKKIVDDNGIKILVHGPAGAGKTVLSATAGEPTLIISAEGGLLSIREAPDYVKGVEIESLDDLDELYEFLLDESDDPRFKWVCLDSISEIAERVLAYEKKNNRDPRAAYGNLIERMMDILRDYRDLPGYNVLMTCKQERIKDDVLGLNMYMPMMPGAKLAQQIPYIFDEVFALRVEKDEDGEEYRVLQTRRDARYEAKDRSGLLDEFEEPSLKKISAKIFGGKGVKKKKPKVVEEKVEQEELEEVEQEVEQESKQEPDDLNIAENNMYFHHDESDQLIKISKGESYDDVPDDFVEVTAKFYREKIKQQEQDFE